eukprot:scaffold8161_cov430-Prasinococcus_capsulatus_cf.AAC.2
MFKVQPSRSEPGAVRVSAKVREKGFQRGKQAILKRMFSRAPKVQWPGKEFIQRVARNLNHALDLSQPVHASKLRVVDTFGGWMSKWHAAFHELEIEHLRSLRTLHLDPLDLDALNVFAEKLKVAR